MVNAAEAVRLGMVDEIRTFDQAVAFAGTRRAVSGTASARTADADYRHTALALAKARQRPHSVRSLRRSDRADLDINLRLARARQRSASGVA